VKIILTSVFVDDQQKALEFYTEVLGFQKKHDVPMGEFRWLTLVSSEQTEGVELLLEPNNHPAVKPYQQGIKNDNIPAASFEVDDIQKEFQRMKEMGVKFHQPATDVGPVIIAMFDDTCGNLIQIMQRK